MSSPFSLSKRQASGKGGKSRMLLLCFTLVIRIASAKRFQRNVDGKWSARKWSRGLQRGAIILPLHWGSNADRATDFREYKEPKLNPLLPLFHSRRCLVFPAASGPRGKAFHPHLPVPDAPISLESAVWYPCRHVWNSIVPRLFSIKRKILQKASLDLYVRSIEYLLMVWRPFQILYFTIIHETSYTCVCIYVSYVGAKFYRPLLKRRPQIQPSRKKQSLKRAQRFGSDSFSLGTVRKAPPWPRRA